VVAVAAETAAIVATPATASAAARRAHRPVALIFTPIHLCR
jgi:hypothetical protein